MQAESGIVVRNYRSSDGQFDSTILWAANFVMVMLSGRAETDAAREFHIFARKHLLTRSDDLHIIVSLDHVSFLSSTALGTIGQIRQRTRRYFIVSGLRGDIKKGLAAVGVREKPGEVYFFAALADMMQKIKFPERLAQFIRERQAALNVVTSEGLREADILKSYYPDWTAEQIKKRLTEMFHQLSEAFSSNYLILPATFDSVVPVFIFLRRLVKEHGLHDASGNKANALSDADCEALAKEVVENIVRWAFNHSERQGGFVVRANTSGSQLLLGFADWGQGQNYNTRNRINRLLGLGGQGHKRIRQLIAALYDKDQADDFVRSQSPAPVFRTEQRAEIEKKLGPQRFGPGFVLVLKLPIRKRADINYESGNYPANLEYAAG